MFLFPPQSVCSYIFIINKLYKLISARSKHHSVLSAFGLYNAAIELYHIITVYSIAFKRMAKKVKKRGCKKLKMSFLHPIGVIAAAKRRAFYSKISELAKIIQPSAT